MTLTRKHARQLMRLLGKYQTRLESSIESAIPGPIPDRGAERLRAILTAEIKDVFAGDYARERLDWHAAEAWVRRLEGVR